MAPKIEAVIDPVTIGEGPHWDHEAQALYFVSILDYTIHKFVPATGKHTRAKMEEMPTLIIPVEGKRDHFVVSLGRRLVAVHWAGGEGAEGGARVLHTLGEVDEENPGNRFNDGKCDPAGRLFAGTMGNEYEPGKFLEKKGSLYRLDGTLLTRLADKIDISNGLCWDVSEKAFYFADSFEYTIRRYDYDIETGMISNPRNVFSLAEHGIEGIADGMTIDTDGNLWVANFDGSQILKIDPKAGAILEKIPIPALQVTSCTFGGPNLDELYVTTACMNRGADQPPPCGATFKLTGLGVRGHKNVPIKLGWL